MNAIKQAQKFIAADPLSDDAKTLASLVLSLESREPFALHRIYELDLRRFDLALDILKEWRLDRYYAGKSKLFDLSLQLQDIVSNTPKTPPAATPGPDSQPA